MTAGRIRGIFGSTGDATSEQKRDSSAATARNGLSGGRYGAFWSFLIISKQDKQESEK